MTRPRVLLLCGGQSEEHEVSLASARSVLAATGDRYEVMPLVISKSGYRLDESASRRALLAGQVSQVETSGNGSLSTLPGIPSDSIDVVFPLLHGPFGEDGTVQGLFKLMGLPFVGSSVLASAVGMDKIMMKTVFAAHGFPQVPFESVTRHNWQSDPNGVLAQLTHLPYPLFVKPANLGSSVGISKATDRASLELALNEAARHDRRMVVEQGLSGARELEIGVLGNDTPELSPLGEITYQSDFYDYSTKYTEGKATMVIPAEVPRAIAEQARRLALGAFKAVDAAGLARIDFFYTPKDQRLYLNEINTMPGFTVTSMYPKLFEAAGVSYPELVTKLIELALEER